MESEVDEESRESQVLDVIPVRFGENYENQSIPLKITSVKGKYYKQTYRTAWEQMPDFKGWLRGVQGEPTRAFCTYCQKTLHAHRLSLLKHTCTIRHQKAAQLHNTRKVKGHMEPKVDIILGGSTSTQDEADEEGNESLEDYGREDMTVTMLEDDGDHEQEIDAEVEEEEEEGESLEKIPGQIQKQTRQQATPMGSQKPPISTHVLDTSKGQPVAGLQVSLYKLIEGRWTYINEGLTNAEGRFANFLDRNDFTSGRYKLHYDVDRYFESRKQESLYPFIEIVVDCRSIVDHYHVPLLISPYGYTTYRGS